MLESMECLIQSMKRLGTTHLVRSSELEVEPISIVDGIGARDN